MIEEKEIHLRDYARVIQKRRSTVLVFFVITFIVVLIGTLSATPMYMATANLLVEKNEVNPLDRYAYYGPQDTEFIATQSQIIKSSRVARKVVKLLDLERTVADYFPKQKVQEENALRTLRQQVTTTLHSIMARFRPASDQAGTASAAMLADDELRTPADGLADMVAAGINVTPILDSKIITVSFTSESPLLAKRIANTVATAYIEEILEMKMSTSNQTIKWMSSKAEEERSRLAKAEQQLQNYMRANDIITVENRIAIIPQKLTAFSNELSKAEQHRKEMEALVEQAKPFTNRPEEAEVLQGIANHPEIQALRRQIQQSEQKIDDLSKKYGARHPAMVQAASERDGLLDKKKDEIRRIIESLGHEYELAKVQEENLQQLLMKTKATALTLGEKFIQYGALQREVETAKLMYEALFAKLKEQDITEQNQKVNVWIVENAELPQVASSPKVKRNLLLGIVLGLFGGIGLAFFIEYLDNTVKTPEDLEERLGLPSLGTINRLSDKEKKELNKTIELITLDESRSAFAEEFKSIRTSVMLSSADHPPACLAVSSMMPSEGKTTTATNLAASIALSGKKVILIDGDLRKPRIHTIFKLHNSRGLSTYLAGGTTLDAIQTGPHENLSILTAGPIPPNPSELLSSRRLREMIEELKTRFDLVIFDTAPVISVTDTLIIGTAVEGLILVTRAEQTTYEVLEKGIKQLQDVKATILGLVVNAFDRSKYQYYYGKYYGKYYGTYYGTYGAAEAAEHAKATETETASIDETAASPVDTAEDDLTNKAA